MSNPRPTKEQIESAINVLTDAIGCYGMRTQNEIAIHWRNGVRLTLNGQSIRGGPNRCAEYIAALEPNTTLGGTPL